MTAPGWQYPAATPTQLREIARAPGSQWRAWLVAGAIVLISIVAGVIVSELIAPHSDACTGTNCGGGPEPRPLGASRPYVSSDLGFSLDAASLCPDITTVTAQDGRSIDWQIQLDGPITAWPARIEGEAAAGRTARAIVEAAQSSRYPGAEFVYEIPAAQLGYQAGYGGVYDLRVGAGAAEPVHARAIVVAATQGDLALILATEGPYKLFDKGHPNPASTWNALCVASFINSIVWPGQPPP
jgi:hypothetical protein